MVVISWRNTRVLCGERASRTFWWRNAGMRLTNCCVFVFSSKWFSWHRTDNEPQHKTRSWSHYLTSLPPAPPPPPSSSLMIYRSSEQSPSDSLWRQTLWSRFWFHRENMMIYIHVIGQLSKPQTNHRAIMLFLCWSLHTTAISIDANNTYPQS